jgi:hypothetical protein
MKTHGPKACFATDLTIRWASRYLAPAHQSSKKTRRRCPDLVANYRDCWQRETSNCTAIHAAPVKPRGMRPPPIPRGLLTSVAPRRYLESDAWGAPVRERNDHQLLYEHRGARAAALGGRSCRGERWFVAETAAPTHGVHGPEMRFKFNAQIFSHGWELPARMTGEGGRSGRGIPADARHKPGSGGQLIAFVPSLDLVITRQTGSSGEWLFEEYLRQACAAVIDIR